jgi:hypothetical protein
MAGLGGQVVAQEMRVQRLLTHTRIIGGIFTMGFDECLILTNDLWKRQAQGIPQHCFLLATTMEVGRVPDPDDEEVILLRVVGPAALSAETELVQVREEAMREMLVARGEAGAATPQAIIDVLTRNEIQFSGIKAKIIGTFYDGVVEGQRVLRFGAGVETFYSSSRYKIYKPYGQSLELIASYPETTDREIELRQPAVRVRIGVVRYTASRRREQMPGEVRVDVPVRVNVQDFVGHKTAVFGMSRLGKSNTMKMLATAIAQHATQNRLRIGQLLFDPAGEYANVNEQDQTALSLIGPEFVTVFRYGAREREGVRSLASNFFNDAAAELTWNIVGGHLRSRGADYLRSFADADVIGPAQEADDVSAYTRAHRRRAAFYACLIRAGFETPQNFRSRFKCNAQVLGQLNARITDADRHFQSDNRGGLTLNADDLIRFWTVAVEVNNNKDGITPPGTKTAVMDWFDTQLEAILKVFSGSVGTGFRVLEPLRRFHQADRNQDYVTEVMAELRLGKVVIIDLSRGGDLVVQHSSERIINHVLNEAAARFANGDALDPIQIYIEEAHTLFSRDKEKMPSERDPYVRLAKEAAKFRIGLIYATQEVTSVDTRILSNTANWIVTHLNNHNEVRELSKYYEFEDYADLTINAEEVGFARIRTLSGRYIVPTQIDRFTGQAVQDARNALLAAAIHRQAEPG